MNKSIGKIIKEAREAKGLTRWQLAEKLHIGADYFKLAEEEKISFGLPDFLDICIALDLDPCKLIADKLLERKENNE